LRLPGGVDGAKMTKDKTPPDGERGDRCVNVLKQLKQFYWSERRWLYVSVVCLAVATALGLVYPFLLGYLIDDVIKKARFDLVPGLALMVVGVITVKALFQFLHGFAGGRLGNWVAFHLRNALYKKLQYLSFQYYDRAKTGDLMSRLTADLEGIRHFIGFGFAQMLNTLLMILFGTIAMAYINDAVSRLDGHSLRRPHPPGIPGDPQVDEPADDHGAGKHYGRSHGQIVCAGTV